MTSYQQLRALFTQGSFIFRDRRILLAETDSALLGFFLGY
jgi:hypothetical protein